MMSAGSQTDIPRALRRSRHLVWGANSNDGCLVLQRNDGGEQQDVKTGNRGRPRPAIAAIDTPGGQAPNHQRCSRACSTALARERCCR